jgi:hypothetical protein
MEKFKYSQEVIDTGMEEIDVVVDNSAYTIDLQLATGAGQYEYKEIVFQSTDNTLTNAHAYGTVSNWTDSTNILSITNIFGEFTANTLVIGDTSNTRIALASYDPMAVELNNEKYDNLYIEQQANSIIDFTEINPFGTL